MKYAYWLSNIPGLSNKKIFTLLEHFSSAEEIYFASSSLLEKVEGVKEEDIKQLINHRATWEPDKKLFELTESGISFVSYADCHYPSKLKNIYNPPYSLYYKGKLPPEDSYSVAIVGARGRSAYGMEFARSLSERLAQNQIPVISGMARGIDGDAHAGAIKGKGTTYAVLGCGVDYCYPKENKFLYEQIPLQGGIISEYPLHTAPIAPYFPARNRIISALCDCLVVVEAREKSGSLITADCAMEQGKDVYVLPGRVTDSLSRGCNSLIRQGAGIILDVDDFMNEILVLNPQTANLGAFHKNLLEKGESLVYSLLDFCPISVGELFEKASLPLVELLEILEGLEQKGVVRQVMPNIYIRTI